MKWEVYDAAATQLLKAVPDAACNGVCTTCPLQERHTETGDCAGAGGLTEIFCKDFCIVCGDITAAENRMIQFEQDAPCVKMLFQLCSNRTLSVQGLETPLHIGGNRHTLLYTTRNAGAMSFAGCDRQQFLEINLHTEFLIPFLPDVCLFNRFTKNIHTKQTAILCDVNGSITVAMKKNIDALIHTSHTGALKQLHIEAMVRCLLLQQLEHFQKAQKRERITLHRDHIDKIFQAKNIIEKNVCKPCSLIDLARQVGTNECTLKKGFRELLDTTVFSYWNDLKMEKAYQMLTSGNSPIIEIAYDSGFKTVQHFTTAFKKKYGSTPAKVRSAAIAGEN